MPIEITQPGSPGWHMRRLFNMLGNSKRRKRLQLLHDHKRGRPPMPEGAAAARGAYEAFQRLARSNYADLIVSAVSSRMTPVGFGTALEDDETGDKVVGQLWRRAGMTVECAKVHDLMLTMGEAMVIVGAYDPDLGAPVVTAEDPRWMVCDPDPAVPRKLRAALKVLHDDTIPEDRAYLFLPGQVWVARRQTSVTTVPDVPAYGASIIGDPRAQQPMVFFNPTVWEWDEERSGNLAHGRIPVIRFVNKDEVGEFETHLDLLGRIAHQTLQRLTIATMQAFRQRAIKGLPLKDENGKVVDYSKIFTLDPAALWQLPETADVWESGQVDLRPILEAVKDDIQQLASVTQTPLHYLAASGVNQSAEGASLSREALVFKTEDRIDRCREPWADVASLMLLAIGDTARADPARLRSLWAPAIRLSLSERADAAAKAQNDLPRRTRLIKIWGMSPDEADRTMSEWADEELLNQQVIAATATPTALPGTTGAELLPAPAGVPGAEQLAIAPGPAEPPPQITRVA